MQEYNHKIIEAKWQKYWEQHPELFLADDNSGKEKKYILDMFPYPSGDGLHVGHVESYTATDIISRYYRMNGKNVLHPQGWDAFGLPAENYAIKTKIHPLETTKKAIETFKGQMKRMGFSYDWSREICSADPEYYRWTQWFFLLLYKNGLAYKKKAKVNWCESCQTVLANEQAEGGICERCKNTVIQKDLEQWFFKITDFVEDKPSFAKASDGQSKTTSGLISGLEKIDWPESTKTAQKNWIGRSEGAQFKMEIAGTNKNLEVFTTRLDTVFGMTFCLIAPEHKLVQDLKGKIENWEEVEKYIIETKKKSDLQRIAEIKEKTGVELKGIKVINPFTKQEIPLFASDFVLAQYGTGAVMAVPAHDERDFDFAKKYGLKIKPVIKPVDYGSVAMLGDSYEDAETKTLKKYEKVINGEECFVYDGILINSEGYDGMKSEEARQKMASWLEENKLGSRKINYKLRDWLVSRQRYWGAPIPIIYCPNPNCHSRESGNLGSGSRIKSGMTGHELTIIDGKEYAMIPVLENQLPVLLPNDVDFNPTGESPLKYSKSFHDVVCPVCGSREGVLRESDTMDTFVCSSWYYLRYSNPKNDKEFASKEMLKKWLPVDIYVGGAEHSVLHLLYARFFTKVLHNLGYIGFDEPFLKLRHQGIILAEDGRKMSKSFGNVINPDQVVEEFGADALRMFEMFMGPLEAMKPWNTKGIIGIVRFLEKVWKMQEKVKSDKRQETSENKIQTLLHKAIKKVTEDIDNFRFNTAISSMMSLVNALEKEESLSADDYKLLIVILSPFAPHITEELWHRIQTNSDLAQTNAEKNNDNHESVFLQSWPKADEKYLKDEQIEMVVQVNGKIRDKISVSPDIAEDDAKELALGSEKVKTFIQGKEIKKIIFVKGRLLNIVI